MSAARNALAVLAVTAALTGLTACSGDSEAGTAAKWPTPETAPTASVTPTPTPVAEPTPTPEPPPYNAATATDEEKWAEYQRLLDESNVRPFGMNGLRHHQVLAVSARLCDNSPADMEDYAWANHMLYPGRDEFQASIREATALTEAYCPEATSWLQIAGTTEAMS